MLELSDKWSQESMEVDHPGSSQIETVQDTSDNSELDESESGGTDSFEPKQYTEDEMQWATTVSVSEEIDSEESAQGRVIKKVARQLAAAAHYISTYALNIRSEQENPGLLLFMFPWLFLANLLP
jgi:hypothetical protein